MRDALPEIRSRGAELVAVGNGTKEMAAAFVRDRRVQFPVLVDPELRTYRAAGLKRGVGAVVGVKALRNAVRALKEGHRQGAVLGDAWQLGGVFVIGPGDIVRFEHVSNEAGDHPPVAAVLAALPKIAPDSQSAGAPILH